MLRTPILLLSASLLLCFGLPADAQSFTPKSIQFKGVPEYSDQDLMAAAGIEKGKAITAADINGELQRLLDSGLFAHATFAYSGGNLVFTIEPSPELYSLRLDNLPLTPGKELDDALHRHLPLYHGQLPFDGGLTEQVRQTLEEMLAAKGIKATVAALPFTDQKQVKVTAINFVVTAPPVRMGEIHLEGVSPEMQAKVKAVADRARKINYNTENAVNNIEHAFTAFYADEGYAAAIVHVEQAGNSVADSEAIEIPFNVTVMQGQHYTLGAIHLPSGELLTVAEINNAAGVKSNALEKMSIKQGVTLRTALQYVSGECKSKGYMDCAVTPHPEYDDANSIVNYKFEVQTGPIYTMGKLTIENTADDLRAAMLAAWKLPLGAVFSEKALHDYYYNQGNTPLGRTFASAKCTYKLATNIETHIVDVSLRLERMQ